MEKIGISVADNITQQYEELFAAEKKAAKYILDNMTEAVNLNVTELAQKSGASEATVVRMCKHLGYDGYFQMRLLMSRDIGQYRETKPEEGELISSRQLFALEADRINNLAECISMETLIEAAGLLLKAEVIHIVSVGNTVTVAMDLGFRLERNGLRSTYSMLPEHFLNHIALGNKNDVVVAITRSGSSTQVVRAVELAHKKGMKTVVITGELNKPLINEASCVIRIIDRPTSVLFPMRPDSHLPEIALSDMLLHVIRNYNAISNSYGVETGKESFNEIDLLLSEFKI